MKSKRNGKLAQVAWLICCLAFSLLANGQTAIETHGALSVNGNRIVNKNGEAISLAGASLFWSNDGWGGERFYRENTVKYLQEEWNATLVRAAMGVDDSGGYLSNPSGNQNKVETIVDAAIANGMYVIIDWHSHHAENYPDEAVAFFETMARKYGETENVIYEIYNEPLNNVTWAGDVKPYAETVINAIRAIDPDNLIIVGSPSWSQKVDVASRDPITGYINIAYTLHFYAGTHGASLRARATTALNNGIALFVTEWGTVDADGDGDVATASTETWIQFLRDNQISHANWAFNDKLEGASVLNPSTNPTFDTWPDTSLTTSGTLVKSIVLGWDTIDYDNHATSAFSIWLSEHTLPEGSNPSSDPFETGRTLAFDFSFGLDPRNQIHSPVLTIEPGFEDKVTVRIRGIQESVTYSLQASQTMNDWSEVSNANGTGDWIEIELESPNEKSFYQVKAVSN